MSVVSPFRETAVRQHQGAWTSKGGAPLQLEPRWVTYAYRLVVVTVTAATLFLVLGRGSEYASGPALLQTEAFARVSMPAEGVVERVAVVPGERVSAGQVLVELDHAEAKTTLNRLEREVEAALLELLRDPEVEARRQTYATLRAQRDAARAQLDTRVLRAPRPGTVSDLRVRAGQRVSAGEPLLALVEDTQELTVTALVPGRYRPLLGEGQRLWLELEGFPGDRRELSVQAVAAEVVGPEEAQRYLGPEGSDAVALQEPVVLVRAQVPRGFTSGGRDLRLHAGMRAHAEIQVRTEPLLFLLMPSLRSLFS